MTRYAGSWHGILSSAAELLHCQPSANLPVAQIQQQVQTALEFLQTQTPRL